MHEGNFCRRVWQDDVILSFLVWKFDILLDVGANTGQSGLEFMFCGRGICIIGSTTSAGFAVDCCGQWSPSLSSTGGVVRHMNRFSRGF